MTVGEAMTFSVQKKLKREKTMRKMISFLTVLFGACLGLGFVVSKFEKKKGWANGHRPYGIYEKNIKRPLDFGLALFALIMFWPFLLIIAIAVRINMGSPVIFSQERPGLGGEIFKIKKFRTMSDKRDSDGNLLPDEQRLTRFGRWLRASSGDEGCELFNIIKGELAIVGPRPLMVDYLPRYSEEQSHRHDVRPGLTGYAQAHGRNALSWEDKFAMDVWYTKNITFKNDVMIIFNNIRTVLTHEGISSGSSATMEAFMGTPEGVEAQWKAPY